jgi:uncharacterized membrane protein SpoIIM required for sporulation
MKEAAFVKQNQSRWLDFEKIVQGDRRADPDRLAELFIQLTDDLSFARTQYPGSRTTNYLNALTSKVHLAIYRNRREERSRFITFWKYELPAVMYTVRRSLLISFIVFVVAGILGAVSVRYDDTFVRLIMGDDYVNMTLENIRNGNPTKVYASQSELMLFVFITTNNIMVSLKIFVFGIFASLGTGVYLFYNGLMVGTFIMFFAEEQQLGQALPTIMLHGTIELTSIVIAATAGFTMGNSLLFPGTYPRLASLKIGAKKGLKIILGLVPFFVLAGFIESTITRYAFMHWSLKTAVILPSAVLMIYYFLIYPQRLKRHGKF